MSDDWQPGDLALCVSNRHPAFILPASRLARGRIYTVARVGRFQESIGERALGFLEVSTTRQNYGFPESLFRKIRPHTPDAEDAETIALLTGGKVTA